jgi:hypothetical protein
MNSLICISNIETKTELNSAASVRDRNIPTDRPPLVGEASANFSILARGQREGSLRPYSQLSRPKQLFLLPSSSSVVLTRLGGPRSKSNTSQKIW